jgi:hypothetical protein
MSERTTVVVDGGGFVYVNGVKVGRAVFKHGEPRLQFHDKDRRRSAQRGSNKVECHIKDLAKAVQNGDTSSTLDTKG